MEAGHIDRVVCKDVLQNRLEKARDDGGDDGAVKFAVLAANRP